MIGCDIEHNGDLWTESLNCLQLETRYFQHYDGLGCRPLDQRDGWGADVAADHGGESARRYNLTRQRGSRGLAIRTSDGHNFLRQKSARQFDLADHGFAQGAGLDKRWRIHRNPGAHHDEVLSPECTLAVSAGLNRDAMIEQNRNFLPKLLLRLCVRYGYVGAA